MYAQVRIASTIQLVITQNSYIERTLYVHIGLHGNVLLMFGISIVTRGALAHC